jgi:putative membrane protein insertion efficiency factor
VKRFPSRVLLALVRAYQRWISPAFPRRCKYEPTCSAYAAEAIRELGPVRGTILAGWRLLRCNPFSRGGIDDVSDRTLFRGHAHHAHPHTPPATSSSSRPGVQAAEAGR